LTRSLGYTGPGLRVEKLKGRENNANYPATGGGAAKKPKHEEGGGNPRDRRSKGTDYELMYSTKTKEYIQRERSLSPVSKRRLLSAKGIGRGGG